MTLGITGTVAIAHKADSTAPLDTQGADWRAAAIEAHRRPHPDQATPTGQLATAVRRLTGRTLDTATVVVDAQNQAAWGVVDGVRFRWRQGRLAVIRTCAHCGCGAFASRPVATAQELGYVLSGWQPLHAGCRPFTPDDVD